jgi:hypothetical protein
LITSINENAYLDRDTTEILILTSPSIQTLIQKELEEFDLPIFYYILDVCTLFGAGCARLHIFKYESISKYDKILYLDTDILINSNINVLFDLDLSSDKLYALEEGSIGEMHWGSQFFDLIKIPYNKNMSAFTSGILLFKNSNSMQNLFNIINLHIIDYIYIKKNNIPVCLDQPFIVYNAILNNNYDNQLLKMYVENNPSCVSSEKIVYHFPGCPGAYDSKISKMTSFWKIMNIKVKICHHGTDGFGHQLEGILRLVSISLNNKAEYIYNFKKEFVFEHTNFDKNKLNLYLLNALDTLSNCKKLATINLHYVNYNEKRSFEDIIKNDNYSNTLYCYDGVGNGQYLPSNFENIHDLTKSLPKLRDAFVLKNTFLPKPTYDNSRINVVCHIRLGDAIGTRILDNDNIVRFIKQYQLDVRNHVTIHSNGNVDFLKSDNTTIYDKNTDVLQVLSDFIYADILVINYSSLSIAAHLLAHDSQEVFCPSIAGPTFYKRILGKCKQINLN